MKKIALHSIGILLILLVRVGAEEIEPGEYKGPYLLHTGESHPYTFDANEGDVVTILMGDIDDPFPGSSGSGFWPQVELIEPNGTRTQNWGWDSARIDAEVITDSGMHLIIVREQKGHVAGKHYPCGLFRLLEQELTASI